MRSAHRDRQPRGGNGVITRGEFLRALKEMREDWTARFEAVDRRFEAIDRRFEEIVGELKLMRGDMIDHRHAVNLTTGRLGTRVGRNLEAMAAGALRYALRMRDIREDQIKMRQRITDEAGRIGPAGRTYEVDILVRNGDAFIFEVKSMADEEDIERFNDKATLAIEALKLPNARKVLFSLARDEAMVAFADERGILLT